MLRETTISDIGTEEGEPRVVDTALGESLGFARPYKIRELIDRNLGEVGSYGPLPLRRGQSRGQEFEAYLLNEAQALLVCMFARTPRAAEVRRQVIEVFTAYRAGRLVAPNTVAQGPDVGPLESRIVRLEAAAQRHVPAGDRGYALALADAIERFGLGRDGDGMHLGPTDLRVCVAYLRASLPRLAPTPPAGYEEAVRAAIRQAGGAGIPRFRLLKHFSGRLRAADLDAALRPLLQSGHVSAYRRPGQAGRPATSYRSWEID